MPTYQYACTACGHQLEAVQSFTDAPLTECPSCDGRLRKVFNSVGIVFKGSGFYRTDSRSGGSESSPGGNGTAPKSDSSSTSESKSDSSSSGASTSSTNSGAGSGSGTAAAAKDKAGSSSGSSKPAASTTSA